MTTSSLMKGSLHNSIADGIYNEVISRYSRYYYFLGKTLTWEDELDPPFPTDSFAYELSTRNEIITMKEIKPTDVAYVIQRNNWVNGTVYDQYDDQYSTEVQGIDLSSGGFSYGSAPFVYIGSQGAVSWAASTAFTYGQMIKVSTGSGASQHRVYVVTNTGISGSSAPTHTTGTELNGTASLQYIAHNDANGSGATATSSVLDGAVIDITLTHRGSGYTGIPTVTIIGGGGASAAATAVVTIAPSGTQKVENAVFYVVTDEFNVYQCLDNNKGAFSTIKPTGTTVDLIETNDGYIWKFLYNIPIALRNKFLTDTYMPVITALRDQFYSAGSLKTVRIDQAGTGYTSGSITVQGDGFATGEELWLTAHSTTDGGEDYILATVSIDPPFDGVSPWLPNQTALVNQKLTFQNNVYRVAVSGTTGPQATLWTTSTAVTSAQLLYISDRLYTVSLAGTTDASTPPTHTSGEVTNGTAKLTYVGTTNEAGPVHRFGSVTNGTAILEYIGTTPTAEAVIEDGAITDLIVYGMLKQIQILSGGSGYSTPPTVNITGGDGLSAQAIAVLNENGSIIQINITDPGYSYISAPTITFGTPWEASTVVSIGQQLYYSNRLYTVTGAGTTHASTPPAHLSGAATNGTAQLTYAGVPATAEASIKYGSGYNSYPSITISSDSGSGASSYFTGEKTEASLIPIFASNSIGQEWEATTSYGVGLKVWYGTRLYTCTTAGISGTSEPTHTSGTQSNGTTKLHFEGFFGQLIGVQINDPGEGYTYANLNVTGDGFFAEVEADLSPGDVNTLQANIELLTLDGTIGNCPLISGGYGYGSATVTINGDGFGATAEAILSNGRIEKIEMTNHGSGYRWATVTITGSGYGAKARAIISPYGGYGKEALNNLYARTLMFYSNISQDKNQGFDVNNDYRQLGIIKGPRQYGNTLPLTSVLASACWAVSATANATLFPVDSIIYKTDESAARFRVVTNTGVSLLLQSIDNASIVAGTNFVNTDGDVFTVSAITPPTADKYSGDLMFIDNKQAFTPTADETVTLRTVLRF
jgi:hypothetical protein